jgi:hypothetical protein
VVSARLLAAGFVLAALVKSAQLPFTPWIARALEGPTPSSAVFYGSLMVHAGVFLLCRLQGLLLQVPDLMALLVVVGLATALYGGLCALVQSDVKSALIFSTVTQVGLMFFALRLRPVLAGRLLLRPARRLAGLPVSARAVLHASGPPSGAPGAELAGPAELAVYRGAAALLDRATGEQPAEPPDAGAGPGRAQPRRAGHRPPAGHATRRSRRRRKPCGTDELIGGHGFAGRALFAFAEWLQRIENRLLLSGDDSMMKPLRRIGRYADAIELLLEQPRYLMLMVMATMVVIL